MANETIPTELAPKIIFCLKMIKLVIAMSSLSLS